MTNPTLERQYQLTLQAALKESSEVFDAQERRLRTLDRQGQVADSLYFQMRLIADARAGNVEAFKEGLRQLGKSDGEQIQALKRLLLTVPEAKMSTFRKFIDESIPGPDDHTNAAKATSWGRRALVVGAVAAVLVVAISLIFNDGSDTHDDVFTIHAGSSPANTSGRRSRAEQSIYQQVSQGTVMVVQRVVVLADNGRILHVPTGHGSGFVVHQDGLVLTNRHVVEGGPDLIGLKLQYGEVVDWDVVVIFGQEDPLVLEARIVHQSPYVDIAMLEVKHAFPRALAFGPTPEPSTQVMAYGFPGVAVDQVDELNRREASVRNRELWQSIADGEDFDLVKLVGLENLKPTVTSGIVSQIRQTGQGLMLQMDTFIHSGNSGGPVVDHLGRVVGVATLRGTRVESVNMAIASKTVHEELARWPGISWPKSFD